MDAVHKVVINVSELYINCDVPFMEGLLPCPT